MAALCSCEPEADENRLAYGGVHVSSEDPEVIAKILSHRVKRTAPPPHPPPLPLAARAPPRQAALF
jgi:hypothetical protein